jgi:hypothetical protein
VNRGRLAARVVLSGTLATVVLLPLLARAGTVGTLSIFGPGNPAKNDTLNQNFATLVSAIDDNATHIGNVNALTTNVKSDLVSAVNELHARTTFNLCSVNFTTPPAPPTAVGSGSSSSPTPGPTPPATTVPGTGTPSSGGSTTVGGSGGGTTVGGTGGGTTVGTVPNGWAAGLGLATASAGHPLPATLVVGKPFVGTIRIQSANPTTGYAGPPTNGGVIVVDLMWSFGLGNGGRDNVVQSYAVTIPVDSGVFNDKTVQFSGIVPPTSGPTYPTGFSASVLLDVTAMCDQQTTAVGESDSMLSITIDP